MTQCDCGLLLTAGTSFSQPLVLVAAPADSGLGAGELLLELFPFITLLVLGWAAASSDFDVSTSIC